MFWLADPSMYIHVPGNYTLNEEWKVDLIWRANSNPSMWLCGGLSWEEFKYYVWAQWERKWHDLCLPWIKGEGGMTSICAFISHLFFRFQQQFQAWEYTNWGSVSESVTEGTCLVWQWFFKNHHCICIFIRTISFILKIQIISKESKKLGAEKGNTFLSAEKH